MNTQLKKWQNDRTLAHVVPFAVFMLIMLAYELIGQHDKFYWPNPAAPWYRHWPEQLFYPIQTLLTLAALIFFWKHYELKWSNKVWIGAIAGIIGIAFWLLPTWLYDHWGMTGEPEGFWQELKGLAPREEGFNPGVFEHPLAYWTSFTMRFIRAVIVVALVEEIFWRGFLMRFLQDMDGNYWKIPFGKHAWISFFVVTGLFIMVHGQIDRLGAIFYGTLTYLVCIYTRSLLACVVMHAVANLIMGWYALTFEKYGLW